MQSVYEDLKHSFNTVKPRRFLKSLPDAYSRKAKKLFYAMGCSVHGHFPTYGEVTVPCCYLPHGTTANDKNIYGEVYAVKMNCFKRMVDNILIHCREIESVELMYQCDFEKNLQTEGTKIYQFFNDPESNMTAKTKPPPPFHPRAGKEVYKT